MDRYSLMTSLSIPTYTKPIPTYTLTRLNSNGYILLTAPPLTQKSPIIKVSPAEGVYWLSEHRIPLIRHIFKVAISRCFSTIKKLKSVCASTEFKKTNDLLLLLKTILQHRNCFLSSVALVLSAVLL